MKEATSNKVSVLLRSEVPWATSQFAERPPRRISTMFVFVLLACLVSILTYASLASTTLGLELPGVVTELAGNTGQLVEFQLKNVDVSRVKAGNVLIVRMDSRPELRDGTLFARIESIAPPDWRHLPADDPRSGEFKVVAALEGLALKTMDPLLPGTRIRGVLVFRRLPLLTYWGELIFNLKDRSAGAP